MDISQVHIVFQRHAESSHNIRNPNAPDLTLSDLQGLVRAVSNPTISPRRVNTGQYIPNGLTQFGVNSSHEFVNLVGSDKLDNVYMLASSPLNRAVQGLQITANGLNLTGQLHQARHASSRDDKSPAIYVHPGLAEATCWPQDLPPLTQEVELEDIASYIKIVGGKGSHDAFNIVGEEHINFSSVIWPSEDACNGNNGLEQRMSALFTPANLEVIEERCRSTRIWLRDCAKAVLEIHRKEGRQGTPRIFVSIHGGTINFITESFYCGFRRSAENQEWRWVSAAALQHLEINVYTFVESDDDTAQLKEIAWDPEYAQKLGKFYRQMANDMSLVHKKLDGTLINHKDGYWEFLQRVSRGMQEIGSIERHALEALVSWTGVRDFLSRDNGISGSG